MHLIFFLKGLAISLLIAVPLGPMALLCIKRTYRDGFWAGWATSLGIALGDAIFATIAGLSLTFLLEKIKQYEKIIELIGIIILFAFGVFTIFSKVTQPKQHEKRHGFTRNLYTSILLTLSNVLTLLGLIAMFSWLGAINHTNYKDTFSAILGVFTGVLGWFTGVNLFIHFFKEKISSRFLSILNKIFGITICFGAILMLFRLFYI